MRSDDPTSRPPANEALKKLRDIKRTLTPDVLWKEGLPKYPKRSMPPALEEHWRKFHEQHEAILAAAAAKKEALERVQPEPERAEDTPEDVGTAVEGLSI
jgi:hypothetical protein